MTARVRVWLPLLLCAVALAVAAATLFYWRQERYGKRERARRGASLLRTLAIEAELCAYARDENLCEPALRAMLAEEDIAWVSILDPTGHAISTLEKDGASAPAVDRTRLDALMRGPPSQPPALELVGNIEDWILPVVTRADDQRVTAYSPTGGRRPQTEIIGVARIGLSRRFTDAERRELLQAALSLAFAVAIVGAIAALLITRRITERVRELNEQLEHEVQGRTDALERLIRELTERNATLSEQRDQLTEMNRLKSQFLANTSHELRTPLNAIIGYAELIGEQVYGPINDEQQRAIAAIDESSQSLLALINQILDLSKVESGKIELSLSNVPLRELCEAVAHEAEALCKQRDYRVTVSGPAVTVRTDRAKVQQILSNLVSNAIKFTERGSVTIEIQPKHDGTHIAVRDTGIGIKPEHQALIFEEFRQVDGSSTRVYGGTGLGLAIAKRFAECLDGTITVESSYGKGTTFTLFLKAAA